NVMPRTVGRTKSRLPSSCGSDWESCLIQMRSSMCISSASMNTSQIFSYDGEICTPENGMGLDGLLRARSDALIGILNGIDEAIWNPREDAWLVAPYSIRTRARRSLNKAALQKHFGLASEPDALLFGVVSRLAWQKGVDLILANLDLIE